MKLFIQLTLAFSLFLGVQPSIFSQYTLTIESSSPAVTAGTVYRFYVDMTDPTDRMSAVFGNDQDNLEISAPAGVFNSTYNASWSASGINEAFLPVFPEMADDSYATIGLDGPASSSGIVGAADPSVVEDASQPITPFFIADGSTLMQATTITGASYYILNTAENGLPDANMRVLIMQLTTTGTVSGTINFQVFPLGVGANQIQSTVVFDGVGTFDPVVVEVPGCMISVACNYDPLATIDDGSCDFISCLALGCTNPLACNYDPLAEYEDGSCTYQTLPYDCDGICINDADGDGVCDELEVFGCTDPNASNYDPDATEDNGLCQTGLCTPDLDPPFFVYFPDSVLLSCDELMPTPDLDMAIAADFCTPTDEVIVTALDGPFEYPFGCLQSYLCPREFTATDAAGNTVSQVQWFTVLDTEAPVFALPFETSLIVNEALGETLPIAEAYVIDVCDANACWSYEDVITLEQVGLQVVERTYTAVDGCGNTSTFVQIITINTANLGCMDVLACNYDVLADTDDGSCTYPNLGEDCNGVCLADTDGDGVCDAAEVDGCDDATACNYDELATENDGTCEFCSCSDAGTAGYGLEVDVVLEHTTGVLVGLTTYRLYITTPHTDDFLSAIFGDDQYPLHITSTTSFYQHEFGAVLGSSMNSAFYATFPELEYDSWVTIGLDGPAGANESIPQLIESTNFSWVTQFEAGGNLDIDDSIGGSWFVLDPQGTDNAYPDADQRILVAQITTDGVPSGTIHAQFFNHGSQMDVSRMELSFDGTTGTQPSTCGCTDILACNYSPDVDIDDGSCFFADPGYDCDGVCLDDVDGDGVCDPFELYGCTDPLACNYADFYTEEDGSCFYGFEFYDCDGICINDLDGDGVCDELEIPGCTDPLACNFNPEATDDDGSCGGDQVNDFCVGAFVIECGTSVVANNEECVEVDDVPSCAGLPASNPSGGLWYSFVGTGGEVTLTTCSPLTTFDTYLSVFEGGCGALTCVVGNDDQSEPLYDDLCGDNAFASTVVFNSTLDVVYLVLVSGVLDEIGTFELSISCVINGCTDLAACNYDPLATVENGSCEYLTCAGCMDSTACNYDATATMSDGSCEFETCAGCMDEIACNYNSTSTIPDDSCTYAEEFYDCDSVCLNDTDGDGVCDEFEIPGCTDELASNFDAFATDNDGSCVYCDLIVSVTEISSILCYSDASASIEITVENANNTILFYELNGESVEGAVINNLTAGDYTVAVLDGPTCVGTASITITQPNLLVATPLVEDVTCFGLNDGVITINYEGGAGGDMTYYVNDVPSSNQTLDGYAPGDYATYVSDSNGCISDVNTVTIISPDELVLEAQVSNVLCSGVNDGEVTLIATGGSGFYEFEFFESGFSDEDIYSNLLAGDYYAEVLDSNGCYADLNVTIVEPDMISISIDVVEASITDESTGSIDISVEGGEGGYTFVWYNESGEIVGNSEDLSDIPGGQSYTVTVTDDNGCEVSSPEILVDEVDGVSEISILDFAIFPNPANDVVILNLSTQTQDAIISIYDATGRLIFEKNLSGSASSISLSVSQFSTGVYNVRIQSEIGVGVKPLLIQR